MSVQVQLLWFNDAMLPRPDLNDLMLVADEALRRLAADVLSFKHGLKYTYPKIVV